MKQLKEARQIGLAFHLLFSLGVCCINELKSGPCVLTPMLLTSSCLPALKSIFYTSNGFLKNLFYSSIVDLQCVYFCCTVK